MKQQEQTILTEDTITLFLDGGLEVECDILAIFPAQNRFYAALMPQIPIEGYEDSDYFLYRYESDGEHVSISDITSEEEWEQVEEKLEELLDEETFHDH